MSDALYIDLETYCDLDIRKTNAYRYVEHPSFEIQIAGYALNDDPVEIVTDPFDIYEIPGLWDADVLKVAHNAAFERLCLSSFLGLPCGEYLPPEHWFDTMAIAAELSWPMKLEQLGKALPGVSEKDSAGTALINLFSKPYRGARVWPEDRPEKWQAFCEYCRQDVVTLREAHKLHLGKWPTNREYQIYMQDQRINDRGLRIDTDLAKLAGRAALANKTVDEEEFREVTGVDNPASNVQVMRWAREVGLDKKGLTDLQAETVEAVLLRTDLTDQQRRALELRQELALVAAKKFNSALASVNSDGRLRGSFKFHGAHTGRWSGRGVQPQNLPRASFYDEEGEFDNVAQEAAITDLELGLGGDPQTLKALVRSMFLLDGVVVDYASIEARVIAWNASERWALEAFHEGRDIYVETANRMGGLTRSQGKVAVLALGFQGGPRSLKVMARPDDYYKSVRIIDMPDEDVADIFVKPWRKANPSIVRWWYNLEDAFRIGNRQAGRVFVERHGNDRAIVLPSKRRLWYRDVKTERRLTFADWTKNGFPQDTYGGRLAENVTQAIARDIMAEALVRLEREGYRPVGHVHDEILVEETDDVAGIIQVMTESPRWASGLPIAAAGFTCGRYRKG